MTGKDYFRQTDSGRRKKFFDYFQALLEDFYKFQKKSKTNKERKGFIDGVIDASIVMGLADKDELQAIIDQAHMEVFGKTLEERKALIKSAQLSEDVLDIPTFRRFGKKIDVE